MLSAAQIAGYQADGYAIVRGVMGALELGELRDACDELSARARTFAADTFVGATFFNMHRDANPFAKNIREAPPVTGSIRHASPTPTPCLRSSTASAFTRVFWRAVRRSWAKIWKQIVSQVNFNPPGSGVRQG